MTLEMTMKIRESGKERLEIRDKDECHNSLNFDVALYTTTSPVEKAID